MSSSSRQLHPSGSTPTQTAHPDSRPQRWLADLLHLKDELVHKSRFEPVREGAVPDWTTDPEQIEQVERAVECGPVSVGVEATEGEDPPLLVRFPSPSAEDFPPLDEDYLRECLGEYPDFLYHIARNRHGLFYFRVIRNLLLDKGIYKRSFLLITLLILAI